MRLCFFGGYDPSYPRNVILRKGLSSQGVEVAECRVPPGYRFWLRYPLLFFRYLRLFGKHDYFFIPEFCQKDLPLAKFLALLTAKKIIFDPLASRYETKILDRKIQPEKSLRAWWNHRLDAWAFHLADLVLADTQAHRDYYCQEYRLPPAKTAVLPVGFDDEIFKPLAGQEREKDYFKVFFFGSFLPLHGVEAIVQAAKILSSLDPSIRFSLAGSGQTLPLTKELAFRLKADNICFEGWLLPGEIPGRIAGSEICLGIFGRTDKARRVIPHKIFQALAMKKPVITSATPAVQEFFSPCQTIWLCAEPYPESLARAILELKADASLRERLAEEAYQLVWQKFTPQALGLDLIQTLNKKFRNPNSLPLSLPPFKGRLHPDFYSSKFIRSISDCGSLLNQPSTRILLDSRNRIGVVCLPRRRGGGVDVVIKEFRPSGLTRLKSLFLQSKAQKAWRGSMALAQREIETPHPVAYLERRKGPFVEESYFLSVEEKGAEEIRYLLRRLHPQKLQKLLEELARHLSFCHRQGILHRDLSDGNILVKEAGDGSFYFFLIDTNRVRIKKRLGLLRRTKNLIRLGIPPHLQRFFLEKYLAGSRMSGCLFFWYKLNKKAYSGFIGLKKALRLRKLSRRLGIS